MKMKDMIRKSCFVAVVAAFCFGTGAFAQSTLRNSVSVTALTHSSGVFVVNPFTEKKKKRVAAAEGGAAPLYLLLAGLTCFGAMFVRSRQASAEKSA